MISNMKTYIIHDRCLPTAEGMVQFYVKSCGNCGGQHGTGAGFLRVLQVSLPVLIPLIATHHLTNQSSTLHSLGTESVVK
jgi:hypothetical protein